MKNYRLRNSILAIVVLLLIGAAPFFRFYVDNRNFYWPYYDWEIGFGNIPFTAERPFVFLSEVDGQVFKPPVMLSAYFLERRLEWNPTSDYLIQLTLLRASRDTENSLSDAKKLFGDKYLQRISKKSVSYILVQVTFDPIEYRRTEKTLTERVIFTEHYER